MEKIWKEWFQKPPPFRLICVSLPAENQPTPYQGSSWSNLLEKKTFHLPRWGKGWNWMNVMQFEEKSIDYGRGQQLGGVSILSISLISRHGMGLLEGTVRSRRRRITIAAANLQKISFEIKQRTACIHRSILNQWWWLGWKLRISGASGFLQVIRSSILFLENFPVRVKIFRLSLISGLHLTSAGIMVVP